MKQSLHLQISIDDQTLTLLADGQPVKIYPVSTAAKGTGFENGSFRTPTGRFRIADRIGEGMSADTIFRHRQPIGTWDPSDDHQGDLILSRILLLDGLDEENANTLARHIYIHGTNHEDLIGQPASHGCIRLTRADMVDLFERVETGASVEIEPATRRRGKLFFFDCDSTLSTIEGIDELARARGGDVFARVAALTDAAMNGEVPLDEVFTRRMDMIRPDRAVCEQVAALYVDTLVPGVMETVTALRAAGWLPVILSGGFEPLIRPLAEHLGIDHVEAVPLYLHEDGTFRGYGNDYPTTRNLGKNEIIRRWKHAMLPEHVVMMGDGISDMETRPDVDVFIGFGGVAARPKVRDGCDIWLEDLRGGAVMQALAARNL